MTVLHAAFVEPHMREALMDDAFAVTLGPYSPRWPRYVWAYVCMCVSVSACGSVRTQLPLTA
jgi:hypothetical protein